MRLKISQLRGNEIKRFKSFLHKYKDYDKIDLIVHKTLKSLGCSVKEFRCRKGKEKEKEVFVKINAPSSDVMFCDSEHCEYDPTKAGNC